MRVLVYGLQSSGASLFTYFMAQKKDCIGIIDLFNKHLMPSFSDVEDIDIVAKCVVTTRYPLQEHVSSFKPDKTILFIRNPYNNWVSLSGKSWKKENGTMEQKFAIMEDCFVNQDRFDTVVKYEDFVGDKQGTMEKLSAYGVEDYFFDFKRQPLHIRRFNNAHSRECVQKKFKYNTGKLHIRSKDVISKSYVKKVIPPKLDVKLNGICPELCKHYDQ